MISLIEVLARIGGQVRGGQDVGGHFDAVWRQADADVAIVACVPIAHSHRVARHDSQRPPTVTDLGQERRTQNQQKNELMKSIQIYNCNNHKVRNRRI